MQAILVAAVTAGTADACDLQLYDPETASLQMEALRGFSDDFAAFFATVDRTQPTACATALNTREAVLVDDVGHSPVFPGGPAWSRQAPLRPSAANGIIQPPRIEEVHS